jgi:hypothetical protein
VKGMVWVDEKIREIQKGLEGVKTKEATKGAKGVIADKASSRMIDKNVKILDKAQARKELSYKDEGINKNSFSIFNSFSPIHFANVVSCGIELGKEGNSELEVIETLVASREGTCNTSGS